MDAQIPPPLSAPASQPRMGLAIAALIVGILACFSSILLVGAVLGGVGLLLGAIHIAKRHGPNTMAWAGIALSVLSIGLSVGAGALYFKAFTHSRSSQGTEASQAGRGEVTDPQFAGWIGKEVPAFTVTDLAGETFQSTDLRGRRVVLDFWATWCPPCRMEIPHFIRLAREHERDELLLIGISSEDPKKLRSFGEKQGINYPIVSADDLPAPFNAIQAIPTTFFLDRNGRIQNVVVGYHDYEDLKDLALAEDLVVEGDDKPQEQR